jgi:hypothetical protein
MRDRLSYGGFKERTNNVCISLEILFARLLALYAPIAIAALILNIF